MKDSILSRILSTATPLKPSERAAALENNTDLESAYASVASKGDTQAPENADDEVDFHYTCFVKSHKNGHLFQMDGDRKRPIDLGELGDGEDVLGEKCLSVIRAMMKDEKRDTVNFSLMALVEE